MRAFLLCCSLAFCGCGPDRVGVLLGSYSLVGGSGEIVKSGSGNHAPWNVGGAGLKLLITRSSKFGSGNDSAIELSITAMHFLDAFVSIDKWGAFDTSVEFPTVPSGAGCSYSETINAGVQNGILDTTSGVLTIDLTGSVDAFCTPNPDWSGTLTEHLQATKDK